MTYRPRPEFALYVRAWSQVLLSCGLRLPWYLNTIDTLGWMYTVVRPPPMLMSSFHVKGKLSPRRTFAMITACRCARRRSSKSTLMLPS